MSAKRHGEVHVMARGARRRRVRQLPDVVERAEKKLRQADHFLGHLQALRAPGRTVEVMEFDLSASLTAAQSAFYVLRDHVGVRFECEHRRWRQTRAEDDRSFLNRMIRLRDDDVHAGVVDATSLTTFVNAERMTGVMVVGPLDAIVEEENPDGTKVRGRALMGVPALYIDHAGQRIEATRACGRFIALLRDLVEHFKRVIAPGGAT